MAARARSRSESSSTQVKPRSDAYVGILAVSLLLQITGAVFLYMDWSQYPAQAPPKLGAPMSAPAGGGGGGVPAAKGAAAPVAPAPVAPAPAPMPKP